MRNFSFDQTSAEAGTSRNRTVNTATVRKVTGVGLIDEVEYATLEWIDWFNNRRLVQPISDVPPAELEMAYCRQQEESAMAA